MARARLLSSIVVYVIGVGGAQPSSVELLQTQPAAAKPRVTQPPRQETSAQPGRKLDAAAVERGQHAFAQSCAFCHGADARGGAQGGSDLLQSPIVLEDEGGAGLGRVSAVGRPEKNMPKFELPATAGRRDRRVPARARGSAASSSRSRSTSSSAIAKAGAAYFNGPGRLHDLSLGDRRSRAHRREVRPGHAAGPHGRAARPRRVSRRRTTHGTCRCAPRSRCRPGEPVDRRRALSLRFPRDAEGRVRQAAHHQLAEATCRRWRSSIRSTRTSRCSAR